jgi:citrate lyase gamma subunit
VLLDATSVVEKQFGAEIATIAQDLQDLPALKINNLATLFQRI